MFTCTVEGICVGVGGFMFRQIVPFISLDVWFLEGFDLYIIYIYIYIYIYISYIYIYIYIYKYIYIYNKFITLWISMFDV